MQYDDDQSLHFSQVSICVYVVMSNIEVYNVDRQTFNRQNFSNTFFSFSSDFVVSYRKFQFFKYQN